MLEVEEELAVTKNKVAQGGVRVSRSVSEQPVEETVTLRTETVEVDHRPVDRKLSAEEAGAAFKDKTLEMIGTTEEVEVTKEARVVGEVSLSKQASEHEQKVQDTVRRTHVEVEQIGAKTPSVSRPTAPRCPGGAGNTCGGGQQSRRRPIQISLADQREGKVRHRASIDCRRSFCSVLSTTHLQ